MKQDCQYPEVDGFSHFLVSQEQLMLVLSSSLPICITSFLKINLLENVNQIPQDNRKNIHPLVTHKRNPHPEKQRKMLIKAKHRNTKGPMSQCPIPLPACSIHAP